MGNYKPRADERAVFDFICSVEDVTGYGWVPAGRVPNVRTPDLQLTLRDKRVITVEITMATLDAALRLHAAAKQMRPKRFHNLSWEWKVFISDTDIKVRNPRRTLKEFVTKMAAVFAEAEAQGGTPQDMQRRATEALRPDPYYRSASAAWWTEPWAQSEQDNFRDWVRNDMSDHCSYWYPPDIVDYYLHRLEPRQVFVEVPVVLSNNEPGGIHVEVSTAEPASWEGEMSDFVSAVQKAIDKKEARGQMANVAGEKWLGIAIDGGNAAAQLKNVSRQDHQSDLSIQFLGFDEIWCVAKTFDGKHLVGLSLSKAGATPRSYTVPSQ